MLRAMVTDRATWKVRFLHIPVLLLKGCSQAVVVVVWIGACHA